MRRADGEWRILEAIGNFDQQDTPAVGGVILNARDITERRSAEEAVTHQAYHDSLTGLPNRAFLADRLATALAQHRRQRQMLGVVFLDIDHFKLVNDTLGHVGGDELLKLIARELSMLVRDSDTVARVGGDEFVLLLSPLDSTREAIDIAQRVLSNLDKRRKIFEHELRVTTSIGISLYPEHGSDPETLLVNADIAMYQAKERGRNGYQVYENPMKEQVVGRLSMVNDLRNALERNEFVVYCQPIVSMETGRIVAAEALVRWQHPVRGLVFPDAFIPLIAEGDLIVALDEWVLRNACRQARAWRDEGTDIQIAVNLSARTLQRPDLVAIVKKVLTETGVEPHGLTLEITESAVMENVDTAVLSLRELRAIGITISVDDFGTGYSSLSYLKRFPIDTVKIDRSFITDLTADPSDAAIVSAIISMAHSLNLSVIAEGVETPEQLAFLRERGCDEYQGYLFARPQTSTDFARLLGGRVVDFPSAQSRQAMRSPSGTS